MFCPNCKAEYEAGFSICADCDVALVVKLIPEDHSAEFEYVELMQTFNQADLAVIKSIFDSEEITYYAEGENFLSVRPLVQPVVVYVRDSEIEKAKKLLQDMNIQYWGASVSSPDDEKEGE